jgi:hypothetical protein
VIVGEVDTSVRFSNIIICFFKIHGYGESPLDVADYDGDGFIGPKDLEAAVEELTFNELEDEEVATIVKKVLEEGDIDDDGKLSLVEFQNVIERAPDFMTNFHIRF